MRILPIDITIHLDTKYKISEVWEFLLEDAFKGYFQPLYTRKINKPLPKEPIEHEKLSREYHASFLEKNLNFYLDQLPTTSKCICGAFKVSTNTNNPLHFIHFLLPEVKIKDGNLHLEWTKLDPALTLDVHWSKHPNEDEFLDMISLQKLGWKGTWPAIVEIITRRPETPKMIGELVK